MAATIPSPCKTPGCLSVMIHRKSGQRSRYFLGRVPRWLFAFRPSATACSLCRAPTCKRLHHGGWNAVRREDYMVFHGVITRLTSGRKRHAAAQPYGGCCNCGWRRFFSVEQATQTNYLHELSTLLFKTLRFVDITADKPGHALLNFLRNCYAHRAPLQIEAMCCADLQIEAMCGADRSQTS